MSAPLPSDDVPLGTAALPPPPGDRTVAPPSGVAELPPHAQETTAPTERRRAWATIHAGVHERQLPRFRILRPHAQGGLGEVFIAHDTELNREVALKEIQLPYADDSEAQTRFLREAEITGRLEDPGIVPVYALGHYADGRPFYAMRLIRGESMTEAIRQIHEAKTACKFFGESSVPIRLLLARFVVVCQTIAFAHSRGVIHRDLKPGNVMLGPYGETLVIDWGLAKASSEAAELAHGDGEPAVITKAKEVEATQAGTVMGTPAYMSPEQAAGHPELLGPASDVYSLGAILYTILTGKPPCAGANHLEVLRQVQEGRWPAPREVRKEIPAELEAICLKAMALRYAGRYPTALALATDVERWLLVAEEEPRGVWWPFAQRAGESGGCRFWSTFTLLLLLFVVVGGVLLFRAFGPSRSLSQISALVGVLIACKNRWSAPPRER